MIVMGGALRNWSGLRERLGVGSRGMSDRRTVGVYLRSSRYLTGNIWIHITVKLPYIYGKMHLVRVKIFGWILLCNRFSTVT